MVDICKKWTGKKFYIGIAEKKEDPFKLKVIGLGYPDVKTAKKYAPTHLDKSEADVVYIADITHYCKRKLK